MSAGRPGRWAPWGWRRAEGKKDAYKPSDAEIDFTGDYFSIERGSDDVINSETRVMMKLHTLLSG